MVSGVFLLVSQACASDKVLDVGQMDTAPVSLTEYFSVLEDPSLSLGLEDVQKPELAARFKSGAVSGESLNFAYTTSAVWLRVHLQNTSGTPLVRMLEIANPQLAYNVLPAGRWYGLPSHTNRVFTALCSPPACQPLFCAAGEFVGPCGPDSVLAHRDT